MMRTERRMTRNLLPASYSVDRDQRRLSLEGVDSPGRVQLRPHRSQTIDWVRGGQAELAETGRSTGNLSPPPFPLRSCCLSSSPPFLSFSAPCCAPSSWTSPQIATTLSAAFSHNWSGALSVVVVSVYCRFHAPPHHEPVFPHTRTCVRIFKRAHTCSGCSFKAVYTHTPSARVCPKGQLQGRRRSRSQSHGLIINEKENYYRTHSACKHTCVLQGIQPGTWNPNLIPFSVLGVELQKVYPPWNAPASLQISITSYFLRCPVFRSIRPRTRT